jgi:PelA/Pel-15E family pectate lyase
MKQPLLSLLLIATAQGIAAQQPAEPPKPNPKVTARVEADYLALHVSGTSPVDATALEYRLTVAGTAASGDAWKAAPKPGADGRFTFDVPLPQWRWTSLEVRAVKAAQVLATAAVKPRAEALVMLTAERIDQLPEAERPAWRDYVANAARHAEHERDVLAEECRQLGLPKPKVVRGQGGEFEFDSDTDASWYGSAEAAKLADVVISFQTPTGGWSKSVSYTEGPRAPGMQWTNNAGDPWHYCGTLDNRATTEQIKFLARVFLATPREDARDAVLRGIEWLLTAQYPNGGWPQNYPVERGYHEAITLNDGAMQHALEVLLTASRGEAPFTFLDEPTRRRAAVSFEKGISCLLAAQVKVGGKPAVWCAQHDPLTLAPVAARLKEPPSLSGSESAEMIKFLMRHGPVTPGIIACVEAGVAWLDAHRLTGLRQTKNAAGKTDYLKDAASSEVYWARFYDTASGQPVFAGAQDGVIYPSFHEMAQHNTVAYDYFTTKPQDVVGKEVERWRKRLDKESSR